MTGLLQGIYEYGDHGGLLLMASHETEGPADSLQFSLDQGACWHTIHLSEAIDIQNIRSHIIPPSL
jgi:sortilin